MKCVYANIICEIHLAKAPSAKRLTAEIHNVVLFSCRTGTFANK